MMHSTPPRISEMTLLLALLVVLGAVPRVSHAVNEFPEAAPNRTTHQASPAQRMNVPAVRVLRVPDLVGQDTRLARASLANLGLRAAGEIPKQTTQHPPGTVIAQDPKPGTPAKSGDAITLWIAAVPPLRDARAIGPVDPVAQPPKSVRPVAPGTQDGLSTSDGRVPPPRQSVIVQPPAIAVPPKSPRTAVVPDLVTHNARQVPALLQAANLALGETRLAESEAPAGTVTSQVPAPGTRVLPGAMVNITVAKPVLVAVPDVTGRSSQDASGLLVSSKLALGERRAQPSEAHAGTIVSQFPAAGTRVALGTRVNVVIAVPDLVLVPNVTGETWEDARRALAESRLGVGERRRRQSDARAGTVVGQAPAAGARVRPGTPVDLVLAVAVPARQPSVTVTPPVQPPVTPAPGPVAQAPTTSKTPAPGPAAQPPVTPTPPVAGPVPPSITPPPDPGPVARPPITPTPPPPAVAAPPPSRSAPPAHTSDQAPVPGDLSTIPPVQDQLPQGPSEPRSPNHLLYGVASALLLGAVAAAMYYRARTTHSVRQQPVTSLELNFVPRWDAGRQQIGPAGPLRSGSGLRLVTRLETGAPSLEDDHLVGAAHDNGGYPR